MITMSTHQNQATLRRYNHGKKISETFQQTPGMKNEQFYTSKGQNKSEVEMIKILVP